MVITTRVATSPFETQLSQFGKKTKWKGKWSKNA